MLVRGARLLPIEVKSGATVRPADLRGLASFLADFGAAAPFGVVLHAGTDAVPAGRGMVALPLTAVLEGVSGAAREA